LAEVHQQIHADQNTHRDADWDGAGAKIEELG